MNWWDKRRDAQLPPVALLPPRSTAPATLSQAEVVAWLKRFRYDPEWRTPDKKVPMTGLAHYAGLSLNTIESIIRNGRISLKSSRALSHVIENLINGGARFIRSAGVWVLVQDDKTKLTRYMRKKTETCVCGRYERCPCGQVPLAAKNRRPRRLP